MDGLTGAFRITTLLAIIIAVAALYFAREVFIPLALALLLSFLLAPLVNRLRRFLGRVPAVIVTVTLAGILLAGVSWFVTVQLYDLARKLPDYQQTIQAKIKSLQVPGGGALTRAVRMFKDTGKELAPAAEAPPETGQTAPEDQANEKPVPVEIRESSPVLKLVPSLLGTIMHPLATAGIVIVFVIFMLIHMEDLRDRFLRLVGTSQMHLTTDALNDAAYRVSRFLLMNLVVNVTYGIPVGIGLMLIGVPTAALWGFLAIVLRFIPYLGSALAALMPIGLAFAVDPGWSMFIATVALFIGIELISNNIVEPLLYGSRTGISPVAVIMGAVFWTWLWGPVGLLLATPLTVCLVVIGRHFPQLEAFNILFGEEPVLTPAMRFYQRLLAHDGDGTAEMAEAFLKERPLVEFYESVLVPALSLAEHDIQRGRLSAGKQQYIWEHTRVLVEELDEHEDVLADDTMAPHTPTETPDSGNRALTKLTVYYIAARDEAEEIVCRILGGLTARRGIGAKALASNMLAAECLEQIKRSMQPVVCIVSLPPAAGRQVRYLAKRLRQAVPHTRMLVTLWGAGHDLPELRERLALSQSDLLVSSIPETLEQVTALVRTPPSPRPEQPTQAERRELEHARS